MRGECNGASTHGEAGLSVMGTVVAEPTARLVFSAPSRQSYSSPTRV